MVVLCVWSTTVGHKPFSDGVCSSGLGCSCRIPGRKPTYSKSWIYLGWLLEGRSVFLSVDRAQLVTLFRKLISLWCQPWDCRKRFSSEYRPNYIWFRPWFCVVECIIIFHFSFMNYLCNIIYYYLYQAIWRSNTSVYLILSGKSTRMRPIL